jgi:hypothetical protein
MLCNVLASCSIEKNWLSGILENIPLFEITTTDTQRSEPFPTDPLRRRPPTNTNHPTGNTTALSMGPHKCAEVAGIQVEKKPTMERRF